MIIAANKWQRPMLGNHDDIAARVSALIADVATSGDSAINEYSKKIDRFKPQWIKLAPFDAYALDDPLRDAIRLAARRIERFAEFQMQSFTTRTFHDEYGEYAQIAAPIERIAAYIPGGKAPLISTALMTLIPAKVAGCCSRIALSPSRNEALLAAASLAGATQFLHIGGAQAIAAAAYGYDSMLPCDMVVGPGNAYVAEAKAQLQKKIRIDTVAGPSEVLITIDDNAPLDWIVEDALAQSEHGPDASAVIVSCSGTALLKLQHKLNNHDAGRTLLTRQQIQLVYADNPNDLVAFCNTYAPEHLHWCANSIPPQGLHHYGALFIGAKSPVALGDYLSGPNHTLPTSGSARRSAGLSVADFLRLQTRQTLSSADTLYQSAARLAEAEGLIHHAKSLQCRIENTSMKA